MSLIQLRGRGATTLTTALSYNFASNVTAGNFIVVMVGSNSTSPTFSVTDSLGNTYTQAGSYASGTGGKLGLFYAVNITGGSCTLTVSASVAAILSMSFAEFSGVALTSVLETAVTNTGTSAAPATGSITAGHADGNLVIGAYATITSFVGGIAPTGFTNLFIGSASQQPAATSPINSQAAYREATTTQSPVFNSLQSGAWVAAGASFKLAAPPSPPPPATPQWIDRSPIGPPLPGSPWFALAVPPTVGPKVVVPPAPPPPSPPVPPVPPPPPGVPPVPPPVVPPPPPPPVPPIPGSNDYGTVQGLPLIPADRDSERRMERFTEMGSSVHNSLVRTGQLIQVGPTDWIIPGVGTVGLNGLYGTLTGIDGYNPGEERPPPPRLFCCDFGAQDGLAKLIHFVTLTTDDLPTVPTLPPSGGSTALGRVNVNTKGQVTGYDPTPAPGTYYSTTVNADGTVTPSTSLPPSSGPTRLATFTTTVGNVDGSENDLYTTTLTAGQLANNGDVLEVRYGGVITSPDTIRTKLYFGGTAIGDTAAQTLTATGWTATVTLIRVSASVVRVTTMLTVPTVTKEPPYVLTSEITGLTLANTQVVKVTAECTGAAANTITANVGYIEYKSA